MLAQQRSSLTPFPNGWYLASYSHLLPVGAVVPLKVCGQEVVLFRTEDGKAHIKEAYCPHLGAHLGHGGTVERDCIRCPFHGWKYDAESDACVHIPAGDRIPKAAKLRSLHVREVSGMVLVWYHDRGAAPQYEVPPLPGFDEAGWSPWKRTTWTIDATIQDISENDADVCHSPAMHILTDDIPELALGLVEGPVFTWNIKIKPSIAWMGLPSFVKLPEDTRTRIEVRRTGLGIGWIRATVDLPFGMSTRVQTLANTTPIDERTLRLDMLHRVRAAPIRPLTKLFLRGYALTFDTTVEEDIRVWEHKVYLTRPAASKSDWGILKFRQWAKQFYSASLPVVPEEMSSGAALSDGPDA